MKTMTAAFAVLLLAGASTQALAQEHEHGDRGGRGDRGQGQVAQPAQAAAQQAAPQAAPRQDYQSPQGGHARFGAPPPSGQAPAAAPQAQAQPQPQAAQPRFERGQAAGQGNGGERRWDRERGPREVIPPAATAQTPSPARDGRDHRLDGGRSDFRPEARSDGRTGARPEFRDNRDGRWNGDRSNNDRRDGDRRDGDRRDWDRRDGDRHDNWRGDSRNNPWGGHGARWQANRFPPVFWSQDRFRIGAYRAPYGYYVRSWAFGEVLPRGWYQPNYFIGDFLDYDLPYPPAGYEWVRVGGDALMVDRFTGRIVQVVRRIFW